MGPNPGGFGSNLTQNISLNTTEFFIRALTYVLLQIQIVQSSEWAKLMTIYSTAQRIETHSTLAVVIILRCRPSYAVVVGT